MKALILASIWCGVCLAAAGPLRSQVTDQGVLVIRQGGREIGREEFRVTPGRPGRSGGDSITATARYPASHPAVELHVAFERSRQETFGFQLERRAPEGAQQLYAAGTKTRMTVRTVGLGTEAAKEFPGSERAVVLDDSVFATWLGLIPIVTAEIQTVNALLPRSGRRLTLSAVRERDPAADKGGSAEVIRFQGDLTGGLYLDEMGRFSRLDLPGEDIEVVRLRS